MTNFENGGFDSLNPLDFGEPTPETRQRLELAINRLKDYTIGMPYQKPQIVLDEEIAEKLGIDGSLVIPAEEAPEGLLQVTQYFYKQSEDPRFSIDDPETFGFTILEANDKVLNDWLVAEGDMRIVSLFLTDPVNDIDYGRTISGNEQLHVSEHFEPTGDFGSPEFHTQMREALYDKMTAAESGALRPTEGTMRQLVESLERAIARRF